MFKKFQSIDQMLKSAIATLGRFPFTMLSATLGVVISILMVELDSSDSGLPQRLLMASALGLPLFIALVLFGEKKNWNSIKILFLQGAGALALIAYYFTLPAEFSFESIHAIRFMLLNIGLHIMVAILPYLSGKETPGFWNYNKSLFLQFLTAVIYSGVLYVGLAIALASADQLFDIDVNDDRYFELWIIMAGLFNTWFFLAGVPKNLSQLEMMDDYPKGLKVFTQYILLPLVTLYIVILFAYEAKIIATWNWPIGWVSNLVLWYSVVGIFSLLLLHPLRDKTENKWIIVFSRWFFRALIPLVVLLFLAILRRISDYGITENRYFVMAMAIGLTVVVLYFVFSKVRDIRIIPIVICSIAFLSSFGPWGAFSVSLKSQQNRLESYLIQNNLLSDGVIQENSEDLPFVDRREMSSIIDYLSKWHGLESFHVWLSPEALDLVIYTGDAMDEGIASALGFNYAFQWQDSTSELTKKNSFEFRTLSSKPLAISGYDYIAEFNMSSASDYFYSTSLARGITWLIPLENDTVRVRLYSDRSTISIQFGDTTKTDNLLEFAIAKQFLLLRDSGMTDLTSTDQLTFSGKTTSFDAKIILSRVRGKETTDGVELNTLETKLLIRIH